MRAWNSRNCLVIRNPEAIRPWQHVLEPLLGYLILAEETTKSPNISGSYNFGPHEGKSLTVREVVESAKKIYEKGEVKFLEKHSGPHEATLLSLNTEKAQKTLNFQSKWDALEAIKNTVNWYKCFDEGMGANYLCRSDIDKYEESE